MAEFARDPIMTLKYMCLGHNTIRGGAGAGILSAELDGGKRTSINSQDCIYYLTKHDTGENE